MASELDLDRIRGTALAHIERSERNFKLVLLLAGIWELLFLCALLVAADFHNRVHVLILLATIGSYTLVALGLFALGAHIDRGILRVLKAVELTRPAS